ncbi:MAG: fibronectin type III domain-containing protein [Armatimonadota bacterium]
MAGNGKALVVGLCVVLWAAACASAQNPFINPGFENGLAGWSAYGYVTPTGGSPVEPAAGCVGARPCPFDVLQPVYVPEGTNVCGMQAWGETKNGGVYQVFHWPGGPATLSVTARAYSEKYPINGGGPLPNACKVRMALVSGESHNRSDVESWLDFEWGDAWFTRSISVPGPGIYTLFIESEQPYAAGVLSTLWDDVAWTQLPPITVVPGDPRIVQPGDPSRPESTVRIEWTTDVPSTSRVDYGPTQEYGQVVHDADARLDHSILLEGLTHTTTYHFRASSSAPGYSDWRSDDRVLKTPIQFDQIVAGPGKVGSEIVVRWITDVPATSRVEYGPNPAYGNFTAEDTQLTTAHVVTIAGLAENQVYHFRVWGRNPPKYSDACSADQQFQTLPPPEPALRNGSFEESYGGSGHSLYPWVPYTTGDETIGYHPIDGLVGPYPNQGPSAWYGGVRAYDGEYFVGAAANWGFKNGGVFQRVFWPPGQLCCFSARCVALNVGGVPSNTRVRIGIDPDGGTDPKSPNIRWWTAVSSANDSRWFPAGITAAAGPGGIVTVFLDIYQQWALEWHVAAVDHARLTAPRPTSIGALKASQGDFGVILEDKVLTHIDPYPLDCFEKSYYKAYVQEDDRSAGIAVYLDPAAPQVPFVGDRITLAGLVVQHNMEAVVVAAEWGAVNGGFGLPRPLGVSSKHIGGVAPIQPSLFGGGGLCNVGLRVRVFGRVTWTDTSSPFMDATVTIDDGGGIVDQIPPRPGAPSGVRVKIAAKGTYGVTVGDYLDATGVVSIEFVDPVWPPYSGDEYYAYTVLTHSPEDWQVTSVAAPP